MNMAHKVKNTDEKKTADTVGLREMLSSKSKTAIHKQDLDETLETFGMKHSLSHNAAKTLIRMNGTVQPHR